MPCPLPESLRRAQADERAALAEQRAVQQRAEEAERESARRQAVTMHSEGSTTADIARATGLSTPTVRNLLREAGIVGSARPEYVRPMRRDTRGRYVAGTMDPAYRSRRQRRRRDKLLYMREREVGLLTSFLSATGPSLAELAAMELAFVKRPGRHRARLARDGR